MKKFEEVANFLGFEEQDSMYIKNQDGFIFYYREWRYLIMDVPSLYVVLNKELDKAELKKLEQAALKNVCASTTLASNKDTLIISLPEGNKETQEYKENLDKIIKRVTKLLKIDGYAPGNSCPVCHQGAAYAKFGNHYLPIHEDCKTQYIAELKEKIESEKKNIGKKVLTVTLSILGCLIGLLPALFFCIYTYGYFTGLLVLVPIGSILGYYFGKSTVSKGIKLFSIILPMIIIIVFSCWSLPYMAKMNELELGAYLVSDNWVGIRKIIFSLLFCFASFGGMRFLANFTKDYQKELDKFLEVKK